jgi:HEAT repeat protein
MDRRRLAQAGVLATALTAAVVLMLARRTRDDRPASATDTDGGGPRGSGLAAAPLRRGSPSFVPGASPSVPVVGERPAGPDLPATIEALRSPDEAARVEAARTLAAAGKDAVEPLLAAVRRDVVAASGFSDFALRAMAAFDELGEVGAPTLARAIGDPEPRMSFWCVATFSRLGALRKDLHAAVPVLQAHLRGGTPKAIQNAAEVLGSIGAGAQAAVPDLARCLRAEEVQSRLEAAKALGCIGPAASSALSDLRALQGDASPTVRRVAAEATALVEGR